MEKIIKIDDKDIMFKCTGGTLYRYKTYFGSELLADLMSLQKFYQSIEFGKDETDIKNMDLSLLDTEVLYQIVWTLAKTANKDIKPLADWLDEFEDFPLLDVFMQLQDLISNTISSNAKKK